MKLWPALIALVLAVSTGATSPVDAACTIVKLAELPVTMDGFIPLVPAKVNGVDALFEFDSGFFWSSVTPAGAMLFGLKPDATSRTVSGAGGNERQRLSTARDIVFHGITYPKPIFLLSHRNLGGNAMGLLGQNALGAADVEYDLANGVVRLTGALECKDAVLAYWRKPGQAWSSIDIDRTDPDRPHIIGSATLNGKRIRVMFDTGAARSILSMEAAARAGVRPDYAGVSSAGFTVGIAANSKVTTWIAPFASFKLGDEEIKNTKLRFGDVRFHNGGNLDQVDLVLGVDFFLSHRIYVAKSQHKLYFTYNGGTVFRLDDVPQQSTAAPPGDSAAPASTDSNSDSPTDAAGFARRAAASEARRNSAAALADLTRAVALEPTSPEYVLKRGLLQLWIGHRDEARVDFDAALKLQPDNIPALEARADLNITKGNLTQVRLDLDAADRAAVKDPAARWQIASYYERAGMPAPAIGEYDQWIAARPNDPLMPGALYRRCQLRAMWNLDLPLALADCNAALKSYPRDRSTLASRGLVYLRMGDYDNALSDYNDALRFGEDSPWTLYGRGVARLRKGRAAEGNADLQAVAARWPHFADEAKARGQTLP